MKAEFWNGESCGLCPHNCKISDGRYGFCNTRWNLHGQLYTESYGRAMSICLDPIEKKPLVHFYPGSKIWSIGSYGCNMYCGFCQNHELSQFDYEKGGWNDRAFDFISPENLLRFIEMENAKGNIGAAFTYNEPTINFEYIMDCAKLLKPAGFKVVLVSNGQINAAPLEKLAQYVDAWNIDIKAWNADFYKRHCGDFETAKHCVEIAAKTAHVEVTTLIIPGENDNEGEIESLAKWLSGISPNIPYHLSRYFPKYKYEIGQTPKETLYRLADVARRYLKYVYVGNV